MASKTQFFEPSVTPRGRLGEGSAGMMGLYPTLMAAAAEESAKAAQANPEEALARTQDERYGLGGELSQGIQEYLKNLLMDKLDTSEASMKPMAQPSGAPDLKNIEGKIEDLLVSQIASKQKAKMNAPKKSIPKTKKPITSIEQLKLEVAPKVKPSQGLDQVLESEGEKKIKALQDAVQRGFRR